jgi:hypothetical protein
MTREAAPRVAEELDTGGARGALAAVPAGTVAFRQERDAMRLAAGSE